VMAALPNIGVEKTACHSHSNYRADVYEAWQLWLERDVFKRICCSFSICSLVFKLHEFEDSPSIKCAGQNLQIFAP